MSLELAWAAGFYDGEGSTFLNRHKVIQYRLAHRPTYVVNTPSMSICQVDRRPLDRFVLAIDEAVKVRGPYKPRTKNSNAYFRVSIEGRDRVCRILHKLWPYMSSPKREQARAVWAFEEVHRGPKSPPMPPLPED